jgi:hypothetical protein
MLAIFDFLLWMARIPGWIARAQTIHNTIRQIHQNRLKPELLWIPASPP